jgi:N4-gp56 family major capsid protein
MDTRINVGDKQAIRRYATALSVDFGRMIYWKKFVGTTSNSIVHEKVELNSAAGDAIQFDLVMNMRGKPVYGDDVAFGKEENLNFLVDEVKIDQIRKPGSAGGRMSRKRTLHDLRKVVKDLTAEFLATWHDEVMFCYASGVAGNARANEDALFVDASFGGNSIEAPDLGHLMYGGDATAKNNVDSADKMNLTVVQKAVLKARTIKTYNPDHVDMKPVRVDNGEYYVLVMSEEQAYDLRTGSAASDWLEIQKNAGQRGTNNPIFTGDIGKIDGCTMHKHRNVLRFGDYGSGLNVKAARALLLGRQALTCAYGSGNGTRMMWNEEMTDYENQVGIAAGMIFGCKKTRFKPKTGSGTGTDFSVISIDTAAAAP